MHLISLSGNSFSKSSANLLPIPPSLIGSGLSATILATTTSPSLGFAP